MGNYVKLRAKLLEYYYKDDTHYATFRAYRESDIEELVRLGYKGIRYDGDILSVKRKGTVINSTPEKIKDVVGKECTVGLTSHQGENTFCLIEEIS